MSKMDGLRAMREARYAEAATRGRQGAASPRRTTGPTIGPTTGPTMPPAEVPVDTEGLCGHRAISGRTCTRERGHAAKSHRYS